MTAVAIATLVTSMLAFVSAFIASTPPRPQHPRRQVWLVSKLTGAPVLKRRLFKGHRP